MNNIEEFEELRNIIHSVSGFDILNRCKSTEFVYGRMIFYALTRNKGYTFKTIGDYVDKDHATVIVGLRKFHDLITRDTYLRSMYLECSRSFVEKTHANRVAGKILRNNFIEDLQCRLDSLILENEILQKTKMMNNRFKEIIKEMEDRTPLGMEDVLAERITKMFNGDLFK